MPGTWQAPEAKTPHNTQAFHPAHCCLLQWQLPRTLKQGHLRSRGTSDAATTLQSIPKGHGPGAGAVSGLMSLKGKLCKPLRTPAKAAVPLAQIPQPHSPHCNGAEPTPKEFSSQLIMRSTSLTQRFHSNKAPILISNIKDAAKAARFGARGFGERRGCGCSASGRPRLLQPRGGERPAPPRGRTGARSPHGPPSGSGQGTASASGSPGSRGCRPGCRLTPSPPHRHPRLQEQSDPRAQALTWWGAMGRGDFCPLPPGPGSPGQGPGHQFSCAGLRWSTSFSDGKWALFPLWPIS